MRAGSVSIFCDGLWKFFCCLPFELFAELKRCTSILTSFVFCVLTVLTFRSNRIDFIVLSTSGRRGKIDQRKKKHQNNSGAFCSRRLAGEKSSANGFIRHGDRSRLGFFLTRLSCANCMPTTSASCIIIDDRLRRHRVARARRTPVGRRDLPLSGTGQSQWGLRAGRRHHENISRDD